MEKTEFIENLFDKINLKGKVVNQFYKLKKFDFKEAQIFNELVGVSMEYFYRKEYIVDHQQIFSNESFKIEKIVLYADGEYLLNKEFIIFLYSYIFFICISIILRCWSLILI